MRRATYLMLIFLLGGADIVQAQNPDSRLFSAASAPKRVNTLAFFETKPEPVLAMSEPTPAAVTPEMPAKTKKEEAEKPTKTTAKTAKKVPTPDPAKISEKIVKTAPVIEEKPTAAPTADILNFSPVVETASAAPLEAEVLKKIFFDRQKHFVSGPEKAYYYRVAKFDKSGEQPVGSVADFYANGGAKKFEGQFRKYSRNDEQKNSDFDGLCKFYEESGAYAVRNYSKGRLTTESKFAKNNEIIAQTEFDFNRHRKKFMEKYFDENETLTGQIQGEYNDKAGYEVAKKQLFYPNGKVKAIIDYKNDCPTEKATFVDENGRQYVAYFQDFSCEPSEPTWKFINKSFFSTTYYKESQSYKVMTVKGQETGILQTPVTYDFYKKSFEIEAVFENTTERPMSEFGLVWEYQDAKNFAYLKINPVNQTYEVNVLKDGIPGTYMKGITGRSVAIADSKVKILFRKIGDEITYRVNGEPLRYLISGQEQTFSKFVRVGLDRDYKSWGVGFYLKPGIINEGIVLKSLEVRLL